MIDFFEKYRFSFILLKQLVKTDFKIRYQGSFLGYFWTLLRPLALFAILYIVFVHFLKFGKDIPHFAVSLLLGIVVWNYFTEVTMGGISAIVGKGDLLRKIYFPRYVIVIAGSFSALINLMINMLVVAFFMIINGVELRIEALLVFLPVLELFVFSLSIAFLLAAAYVKLRDINYVWEVILQGGFYATPILYPISLVVSTSPWAAKILMLNPIAQLTQDMRLLLIDSNTPTINDVFQNSSARLIPILIVLVLVLVSGYYFKKQSPHFAENI